MSAFHVPDLILEDRAIPKPLLTSEPGSFAHNTLKVRIPRIIQETIEENEFPPDIRAAIQALHIEITSGLVRELREDTPDREFWNTVSRAHIGRAWLDVPWYWAEAYCYRRILEATRYFQPGDWHMVDPYRAKKQMELKTAPRALAMLLMDLPSNPDARFERLFHSALWGNRTDLSYNVAANIESRAPEAEREHILMDDTARVREFFRSRDRHVAYIADNAGTELLSDLALIDFLLNGDERHTRSFASQITLHLKPQPFFVSDAMPRDLEMSLDVLARENAPVRALGQRLRGHIAEERLNLSTHWFYATSLFYFQMPRGLAEQLAGTEIVILKGDANYRRLLGDGHWDPTASFAQATAYFPTPLVALRTLKAELVVGLPAGRAEQLSRLDPEWRVNGQRGLIQANTIGVG